MQNDLLESLELISNEWLKRNYNFMWLKAMIQKGRQVKKEGILITGSSHALCGIDEKYLPNCINCSMHSQDIYCDYLCAKEIIEKGNKYAYRKCFIIMGYYISFQDLSRSINSRKQMVVPIYYPLFHDAHNWDNPVEVDLWNSFEGVPEEAKKICELLAMQKILQKGTYYSELKRRKPLFDFNGRYWSELLVEEKERFGKERAASHNKIIEHQESYIENCAIMKDYIHMLQANDITPIVVITPFSSVYNKYIDKRYKETIEGMLNNIEGEIHFVDFNESTLFDDADFIDTDHLNEAGAKKLSCYLNEIFLENG